MLGVDVQVLAQLGDLVDLAPAGVDLVPPVLSVPLRQRRGHVHLLDDVPPADARVVRAERNLAFLRSVGDHAHLRAPEVVVEQVLEPHAGDEQEVPRIVPAGGALAVVLAAQGERLVELLQQVEHREVLGGLHRVVVLQQGQPHLHVRGQLAATRVGHPPDVLHELRHVDELRHRGHVLGLLVDHQRRADPAVRMAAATDLPPLRLRPVRQVRRVHEAAHHRDREPVAGRLGDADLPLHVVRQVAQRVALAHPPLVGDLLVAAREGHRLERDERDPARVVASELDDRADLFVVDVVHQRRDQHDLDAGVVHVLDRLDLDVEQVADLAVLVRLVADPVELQVRVAHPGVGGRFGELRVLGELDAVGRGLHRVVADLPAVLYGLEEVRRHRRLAARELDRHLAARLDLDRVVQNRLDLFPLELVDESDLVGVHEARVAHHVAAVRQIHCQHRPAAPLNGRRAVVVQVLVVMGANVAARELRLDVLEELGIDRHEVLGLAVPRTLLDHPDLVVPLHDRGLDLADLLGLEDRVVDLAVQDHLARLAHALRTQRIGLARPAQRGLGLLPGLEHWLVGPSRREGRIRVLAGVQLAGDFPARLGGLRQAPLQVLNRSEHACSLLEIHSRRARPRGGSRSRSAGIRTRVEALLPAIRKNMTSSPGRATEYRRIAEIRGSMAA